MQERRSRGRASRSTRLVTLGLVAAIGVAIVLVTSSSPAQGPVPGGPEGGVEDRPLATVAADAGAWADGAAMPTARSEIAAAVVDGDIIALAGLDRVGRSLDTVAGYVPAADAWTELASMPSPRDHAAVASWDGRVYVTGGGEFARRAVHANLWAYDPEAHAWASLSPMPRARWQHAMVAIDGILYVVGGLIDGTDVHTAVWAYDIADDAWRTGLAPLPTPREHLAAVAADGRIVVLGGRMGANLAAVEIYDPSSDDWIAGPEMPTPRSGFAAALLADGVHVTGGEDFGTGQTIAAHERLDLGTMTWSSLPDLPTARHGVGSGAVEGRWYVIGGGREVGLSTSDLVEIWTPAP